MPRGTCSLVDDGFPTASSIEQINTEAKVRRFFRVYESTPGGPSKVRVLTRDHADFLLRGLENLSSGFETLDASRPWICYWILNALDILGVEIEDSLKTRVISFLSKCQHPTGGYGGGPGQMAHLAPTYAAVNSLMIVGTEEAYKSINREQLLSFLLRVKTPEGAFRMHVDGEIDTRGTYTALAVAAFLGLLTPEVTHNVGSYLRSCQTYEGGLGAMPFNEAHGGYTFCGLAAAMFAKQTHSLDLHSLSLWCANRQMSFEGGFQGRTNKLVDSCYSFWMGGTFPLLRALLTSLDVNTQQSATGGDQQQHPLPLPYSDTPKILTQIQWSADESHLTLSPHHSDAVLSQKLLDRARKEQLLAAIVQPDLNLGGGGSSQDPEAPFGGDHIPSFTDGHTVEPESWVSTEEEGSECEVEDVSRESESVKMNDDGGDWWFDQYALQEYVMVCCQGDSGGLRDKPGKNCDYYHTCYSLSGVSVAQHNIAKEDGSPTLSILGRDANELKEINPLFGVSTEKVKQALLYFGNRSSL